MTGTAISEPVSGRVNTPLRVNKSEESGLSVGAAGNSQYTVLTGYGVSGGICVGAGVGTGGGPGGGPGVGPGVTGFGVGGGLLCMQIKNVRKIVANT